MQAIAETVFDIIYLTWPAPPAAAGRRPWRPGLPGEWTPYMLSILALSCVRSVSVFPQPRKRRAAVLIFQCKGSRRAQLQDGVQHLLHSQGPLAQGVVEVIVPRVVVQVDVPKPRGPR